MNKEGSVKKMFCSLFVLVTFFSCNNNENWEHLKTDKLKEGVFVERFYHSYGVHAGGSQEYFVTDSLTYRFSVGICDDKQYLTLKIDGTELIVEKHTRRNLKNGESRIIETETYQLPPKSATVSQANPK